MRIHLKEDIRPVSEFRANAAALIEQVRRTRRPLVLTQRGQSAAVVLGADAYEALLDELETSRDIALADRQLKAGKGIAHKEAGRRLKAGASR